MSINQFGNFYFIAIHGPEDQGCPPDLIGETVETIQRPGIDGTAIIQLGQKAEPFQMRSVVDATSFAAAMQLAALYKTYQGHGPYGLIWGGLDFTSYFGLVYVPTFVKPTKVRRLGAATGGLYPPSQGLVECLWTLQPIKVPPET